MIPMRKNKGKSIGACLHNHTSYIQNPGKTEQGELVSSYQCSPLTVDEEFLLTKRLYEQTTGRSQKSDVIAYQVRQSFKPGEVTPEEANRIGYEFAERFLKGKHAFIVATHTDRAHIHNHIIYNSTALDGTRKFKNFWLSTFAVQRLSDLICLEHQLSTIEYKPYRERQKRIVYPPRGSNRDRLCGIIDTILAENPKDFEVFLQKLEQQGYEVKRGKYTAVKGKGQKRFIRFRTLGTGYGEDEIKAVLEGKAKHKPYQKKPPQEQSFQLLVDRRKHCLLALRTVKLPFQSSRVIFLGRNTSQKSSIISVKSVWKRCHMDLPGSTNLIQRKASRTSRLRPIIMWTRRFFKLPLQHGETYGIAVPRFASWYPPSIWKAI